MRIKIILLILSVVFLETAAVANDNLSANSSARMDIEEIIVAAGFWGLGDPPFFSAHRQKFDVWLTPDQVSRAKSAFLEFVVIGSQSSFVEINGRAYLLPWNAASVGYLAVQENTSMAIPVGLLQPGHNSVAFEAGPILSQPNNLYDDFWFRDVLIVLSYR